MTNVKIVEHPDITAARRILQQHADPSINETIEALIDMGEAKWMLDPHVENVVGLASVNGQSLRPWVDEPIKAWLVVYLDDDRKDGDWEVGEDFSKFDDTLHNR